MIYAYFLSLAFAQNLILGPEAYIETGSKFKIEQLISSTLVKKYSPSGMRDEILKNAEDFLNQRISEEVYFLSLQNWNTKGFSETEREIVLDAISKGEAQIRSKKEWSCRLGEISSCEIKNRLKPLPVQLKVYEWVVIGGVPYSLDRWDTIMLGDFETRFIFISSKYETIDLYLKPSQLEFSSISLVTWVSGNCENYQVLPTLQSMDNLVFFSESCVKPTTPRLDAKLGFYKKHEEKIWWTVLGLAILGAVSASGKKVVFTY